MTEHDGKKQRCKKRDKMICNVVKKKKRRGFRVRLSRIDHDTMPNYQNG